ncbi:MAG: phosphomannomutase/phosphoglucomutase [Gammaproteobacteria bacterium]|nr:phosphomannomutase/phosphoglucomutase [Gammaproteobacteria bacterium]
MNDISAINSNFSYTVDELPAEVFRNYDIRGFADSQITPKFAYKLGAALGSMLTQQQYESIYLGRDARLSSPQLAKALSQGLTQQGMNVIDIDAISTPALNYAVHCDGSADCGVMVTASHNAKQYNGFKIIVRDQVIAGELLQSIKQLMLSDIPSNGAFGEIIHANIAPQYIQAIMANCRPQQDFKIVIDCANSIVGPLAVSLFNQLGYEVIPLFCQPDGNFPNHDPNPSDEGNLQTLQAAVLSNQADLGLAFDGDGDRLVVISGSGEILWPDQLLMIFARDILTRYPKTDIVFDVKSSFSLKQLVSELGGNPVMCKTGHSHVRSKVQQTGALVGGEFSGHIFFNDRWHGFDDGLYASVRLLEILANCDMAPKQALEKMMAEFKPSVYTPEILIPVTEAEKFALMERLVADCSFKGAIINTIDGLRVEYPLGWGLIRASNTSANLTMRFEADNTDELARIKKLFSHELAPFINQVDQYL